MSLSFFYISLSLEKAKGFLPSKSGPWPAPLPNPGSQQVLQVPHISSPVMSGASQDQTLLPQLSLPSLSAPSNVVRRLADLCKHALQRARGAESCRKELG